MAGVEVWRVRPYRVQSEALVREGGGWKGEKRDVTRDSIGAACVGSCYACYALNYAKSGFSFCEGYGWGDEVSCVSAIHMDGPPLFRSQHLVANSMSTTAIPLFPAKSLLLLQPAPQAISGSCGQESSR